MEFLRRILAAIFKSPEQMGEWPDTTGPAPDEHPPVPVETLVKANTTHMNATVTPAGVTLSGKPEGYFVSGKWSLAVQKPMHAGRIGRAITPRTLIVHTTDCKPGTFATIVKSWTTGAGGGNGAHFLIGKNEKDGVVQFAPTVVNANHAGGANAGYCRLPDGRTITPNLYGVGVELDNAGLLKKDAKGWYHKDTGYRFSDSDVFVDEKGRGWEKVTAYQIYMLKMLWTALKPTLTTWPEGTTVVPNASYASQGATYGLPKQPSLAGHVSTNPINKTDPGPQVMAEINSWN